MTTPPTETITVQNLETTHIAVGDGEPVLLMHGWGANIGLLWPLAEELANEGYRVYAPDLPGFGGTQLPPEPWGVHEYAAFVLDYIADQGIEKPFLFGHSFGGRVSIVLGAQHADKFTKIVLCDAAGVKPPTPWYRALPVALYRMVEGTVGEVPIVQNLRDQYRASVGSMDYNDAGELRETFLRVIAEDLRPLAPKITLPTLLIWGANDEDTPLWQAKALENDIPDAGLVVFENAGHYSYLDALPNAVRVMDYFFQHDE
ncbi:MAG: alpha/beta hydrolase [Chloroflexota bacterium]